MRTFVLIEEKALLQNEGFLQWWTGAVFFKAPSFRVAWETIKTRIPVWYNYAEDISFDCFRKRVVLQLPVYGLPVYSELVLVMREIK